MASKTWNRQASADSPKVVVALYPFKATEKECLSMRKDERYEVVDDSEIDWIEVINKNGMKGFIPKSYVQILEEDDVRNDISTGNPVSEELGENLDKEDEQPDWFMGDMTPDESERILKEDGRDGVFLVRNSTTIGYSLSAYAHVDRQVKHYRIRYNDENQLYLTAKRPFYTLSELIYYHQHDGAGMTVRLKHSPRLPGSQAQASPPIWDDARWQICDKELTMFEELGTGQFGVVRRGKLRSYRDVAIKIMKHGTMSEDDFIDEAKIMTKLHHPHLVQLLGVCSDVRPIYIVTEYMKHGSLLSFLRKYRDRLFGAQGALHDMCKQVCSGMVYLESQGYLHRDLAARNCLVGERKEIKISDFGLSRYVIDGEYVSSAGQKFPIKWSPPEVILYRQFSSKSDVWSFGVLMWEVFTCGNLPYGKTNSSSILELVKAGKRLDKPKMCQTNIYSIMLSCWQTTANKRPSFDEIKQRLDKA